MQTLLGKVTVLVTYAVAVCDVVQMSSICITDMFSPIPKHVAIVLVMIEYYLIVMCLTSLLALTVTKYISIFYGHFIDMFEEQTLVRLLKVVLILFPCLVTVVEYVILSNVNDVDNYQLKVFGYKKVDSHAERSKLAIVFINVSLLVNLYARIEYSSIQANDTDTSLVVKLLRWYRTTHDQSGQYLSADMQSDFSVKTFRTVAACGLVVVASFVNNLFLSGDRPLWTQLTFIISATVIMPFIFILNHSGMRTTLKKMIIYVN